MNPLKRMYSSGIQKRAEKSRKLRLLIVGTPSINSFFKMQTSGADIPAAAAVVENADTAEEEADVSSLCSDVPTTSKEKTDVIRGEEIDIRPTSSSTATSDCDLFKLDRSFATDRAHFSSTIASASFKSMTLSQGPCHPSGPFEEDGSGRPIVSSKHYYTSLLET